MIDNEIIKEIRAVREEMWEDSDHDLDKFFSGLSERQKARSNLVRCLSVTPKEATLAEDQPTTPYNTKN